jgi:hypothetical protein
MAVVMMMVTLAMMVLRQTTELWRRHEASGSSSVAPRLRRGHGEE